jgi:hypothetical protein
VCYCRGICTTPLTSFLSSGFLASSDLEFAACALAGGGVVGVGGGAPGRGEGFPTPPEEGTQEIRFISVP